MFVNFPLNIVKLLCMCGNRLTDPVFSLFARPNSSPVYYPQGKSTLLRCKGLQRALLREYHNRHKQSRIYSMNAATQYCVYSICCIQRWPTICDTMDETIYGRGRRFTHVSRLSFWPVFERIILQEEEEEEEVSSWESSLSYSFGCCGMRNCDDELRQAAHSFSPVCHRACVACVCFCTPRPVGPISTPSHLHRVRCGAGK